MLVERHSVPLIHQIQPNNRSENNMTPCKHYIALFLLFSVFFFLSFSLSLTRLQLTIVKLNNLKCHKPPPPSFWLMGYDIAILTLIQLLIKFMTVKSSLKELTFNNWRIMAAIRGVTGGGLETRAPSCINIFHIRTKAM